ncbi:hypothetical protein SAMN02787142_7045 [Burkholderia sp. WP9]|nr:hypothetical protein SAMN02787142_7045 [Burkholderia sp. WP9]
MFLILEAQIRALKPALYINSVYLYGLAAKALFLTWLRFEGSCFGPKLGPKRDRLKPQSIEKLKPQAFEDTRRMSFGCGFRTLVRSGAVGLRGLRRAVLFRRRGFGLR